MNNHKKSYGGNFKLVENIRNTLDKLVANVGQFFDNLVLSFSSTHHGRQKLADISARRISIRVGNKHEAVFQRSGHFQAARHTGRSCVGDQVVVELEESVRVVDHERDRVEVVTRGDLLSTRRVHDTRAQRTERVEGPHSVELRLERGLFVKQLAKFLATRCGLVSFGQQVV